MKKVTVIGGGTGTFVVLSGLKEYDELDLASVVTMTDSGGSTGRLRDQLGVLPPGDIRQSLVALSEASELWRNLFLYRFGKGDLRGHNFGNIFLSALEKISGDYREVVKVASYVLKTRGKVIPVTLDKTHLRVVYNSGKILEGEGKIDENTADLSGIKKIELTKRARGNSEAIERILTSDVIIIGPGDLYTSIIPVLLPDGIKKAFIKTRARLIYVVNLMTKKGQTTNFTALDHLLELERYIGRKIDIAVVNNSPIPKEILDWYKRHGEKVVDNDLNNLKRIEVYEGDIIYKSKVRKNKNDKLTRSIMRHDSRKLAELLMKIIYG